MQQRRFAKDSKTRLSRTIVADADLCTVYSGLVERSVRYVGVLILASIRRAPSGTATMSRLPTSAIRPSTITTVASARGAAPVPSMTVAPAITTVPLGALYDSSVETGADPIRAVVAVRFLAAFALPVVLLMGGIGGCVLGIGLSRWWRWRPTGAESDEAPASKPGEQGHVQQYVRSGRTDKTKTDAGVHPVIVLVVAWFRFVVDRVPAG